MRKITRGAYDNVIVVSTKVPYDTAYKLEDMALARGTSKAEALRTLVDENIHRYVDPVRRRDRCAAPMPNWSTMPRHRAPAPHAPVPKDNALGKVQYTSSRPLQWCAHCAADLCGPDSVDVTVCVAEHCFTVKSRLNDGGELLDTRDGVVAKGFYAAADCGRCHHALPGGAYVAA